MIDQVKPGSVGPIRDCEDIKNPRLQGILRHWNELRGERTMPSLGQIDPVKIPRLLPIVLIADVSPSAIRMRLLGTEATNAYGRETRGMDVTELMLGEFSNLWAEAFALVRVSEGPVAAFGPFHRSIELLDAEAVLTPMSDDGQTISHIFGGLLIRPAPCMTASGRQAATGILAAARLARTGS